MARTIVRIVAHLITSVGKTAPTAMTGRKTAFRCTDDGGGIGAAADRANIRWIIRSRAVTGRPDRVPATNNE